jgi:hypothetical protein
MIPLNRGYKVGEIIRCGVEKDYDKQKNFDKRNFVIFIYGATNVYGLIGPEDNGIAILDEDNKRVILDGHCRENTGYFGPSQKQINEFNRIMGMTWGEFKDFVNSNNRSRVHIKSKNAFEEIPQHV